MKLGFGLPHSGTLASPEGVTLVAKRAEELGYESLWVLDRFLAPVQPQTAYPGTPDGSLPENYKTVLDPLHTLSFVAANTSHIALGTSVLIMGLPQPRAAGPKPYHPSTCSQEEGCEWVWDRGGPKMSMTPPACP